MRSAAPDRDGWMPRPMFRRTIILLLGLSTVSFGVGWCVSWFVHDDRPWRWPTVDLRTYGLSFSVYHGNTWCYYYFPCSSCGWYNHKHKPGCTDIRAWAHIDYELKPPTVYWEFGVRRFRLAKENDWCDDYVTLELPSWLVFMVLGFLPVRAVLRGPLRRCRRRRRGECLDCGYNLTGNASGVCPECGTGLSKS